LGSDLNIENKRRQFLPAVFLSPGPGRFSIVFRIS